MRTISIRQMIAGFLFCFTGIILVAIAIHTNPDNDMWWMMATGRHIVEAKTIPTANPFVIHEDFQMVTQQWGLAIVNYLLYDLAGNLGLITFALVAFLCNQVLIFFWVSYYAKDTRKKVVCLFLGMLFCSVYLNTRPTQLTTGLLLAEQIAILKWKASPASKRTGCWLACIFFAISIIEINLHAALWPMIFVTALPHLIPQHWERSCFSLKFLQGQFPLFIAFGFAFGAGFLNPNGVNGILYLFKSYGSSDICGMIREMQSPDVASVYGIAIVLAGILLALYLRKYWKEKEKADLSKISMLAGVLILSGMHLRNFWLLLFGVLPILSDLMPESVPCQVRGASKGIRVLSAILLGATLVVEGLVFSTVPKQDNLESLRLAADYLDTHTTKDGAVLYTTFDSGGYMEWRGYKVYIDARPELFQKKINGVSDVADEYVSVLTGTADYAEFIEKYDFTHIVTGTGGYFDLYLEMSEAYVPIISKPDYILYEKQK